ncbi:MAG TPA: NAD(P)/FAD-dependent oxidoreductase [Methanomassiliicoccales archaeon]|nr:NAD(P)/FAD-dependent oxidoreductase [Methanomassiliicoccales archaeon]
MDYDLVIVGGGPAGLTAGIYAVQKKLSTIIIDAGEAGGQPGVLYPEKEIYNFPCFQIVTGKDLSQNFVEHARKEGCVLKENETVDDILEEGEGLRIVTDKASYTSRTVIIATGNGFFRPKKLEVPGAAEFEGRGVHYMMPEKKEFAGKKAVFVGGGNSALEMALMVSDIAQTVIVHRRDCFRADQCVIERVMDQRIRSYMRSEIKEIKGDEKVRSIVLKVGDPAEEVMLDADIVVIKVGMTPDLEHLHKWGLNLENASIKVNTQMMTSRKGVFACGDAATYPGKYKQIVTGSGEGATAANSAYKYVKKPYGI